MIPIRSSTSDTSATRAGDTGYPSRPLLLCAVTLLAFAVRVQRIGWQPLWWDEGYTTFFATEPLARMLELTAQDIHPPLYYTALHHWIALLNSASPAVTRLFSVTSATVAIPLLGVLASRLTRGSTVASVTAATLLALNPMHVYYSQEIRMYSLAATLAVAATLVLVMWIDEDPTNGKRPIRLAAFVGLSVLALHTLYYAALVVAIQYAWAAWRVRSDRTRLRALLAGVLVTVLLALPWWIYTVPRLVTYIADKVQADQDVALGLAEYVLRHAVAFAAGHGQTAQLPRILVGAALAFSIVPLMMAIRSRHTGLPRDASESSLPGALSLLVGTVAGVMVAAFLVNLRFPFFPKNGERLLLIALPYLLALIAWGAGCSRVSLRKTSVFLGPLLAISLLGLGRFYTEPRHTESDYHAIIALVEQRGSEGDAVLALFPWQVGYWRAYGTRDASGELIAPHPGPVGQDAMRWSDELQQQIDSALQEGVLWFPEPLTLGSTLPSEVEAYLDLHALSVENRWLTPETRLTAWTAKPRDPPLETTTIGFGPITLTGSHVWPSQITQSNQILDIALRWQGAEDLPGYGVSLKLVDDEGRTWAVRDYAPPGRFSLAGGGSEGAPLDRFGLQVPAGIPPGEYTVGMSVLDQYSNALSAAEDTGTAGSGYVPLQKITVAEPTRPPLPVRIGMDHTIDGAPKESAAVILGVAGIGESPTVLAGSDLDLQVVLEKRSDNVTVDTIRVALLDGHGSAIAQWDGWPLPDYPMSSWKRGAIVRVPVTMELPAYVDEGRYLLVASLVGTADGSSADVLELAEVKVVTRPATYEPVQSANTLPEPYQFGTHARLIGYDTDYNGDGLTLTLDWEVLQPLRPLHDVFVHLMSGDGRVLAQSDGPPVSEYGPAPTGGWRTGERITTSHSLVLPDNAGDRPIEARIGLYVPESGVRLPVFLDGEPVGDAAVIRLSR